MSYQVESPADLARRAHAAMRAEIPGTDAMPRENNLAVLAKVMGLSLHDAELRADWIYRQIFASTADADHLDRHAFEEGLARRGASRAEGALVGTGAAITAYPAGLRFFSGATSYVSTAPAVSGVDGAVTIFVKAEQPGAAGNRDGGALVQMADPFAAPTLAPALAVASAGLGGGADIEDDEALRARILDRRRRPPQGGAISDYEQWAMEVPGVTAAWAARTVGAAGAVTVWVTVAGRANGIPTSGDLVPIQDMFNARRRIATAVTVVAPTAVPVAVTVTGLSPGTVATRSAIGAALSALFRPDAEGMPPASRGRVRVGLPETDFVLSRSWIFEAVAGAAGEIRHGLSAPSDDVTLTAGQLAVLGTLSFA